MHLFHLFHFVLNTPRDKKVKNTSTLYHPGCGSQIQTGTEIPCAGLILFRSDPMLIFLSGNRPKELKSFQLSVLVQRCGQYKMEKSPARSDAYFTEWKPDLGGG